MAQSTREGMDGQPPRAVPASDIRRAGADAGRGGYQGMVRSSLGRASSGPRALAIVIPPVSQRPPVQDDRHQVVVGEALRQPRLGIIDAGSFGNVGGFVRASDLLIHPAASEAAFRAASYASQSGISLQPATQRSDRPFGFASLSSRVDEFFRAHEQQLGQQRQQDTTSQYQLRRASLCSARRQHRAGRRQASRRVVQRRRIHQQRLAMARLKETVRRLWWWSALEKDSPVRRIAHANHCNIHTAEMAQVLHYIQFWRAGPYTRDEVQECVYQACMERQLFAACAAHVEYHIPAGLACSARDGSCPRMQHIASSILQRVGPDSSMVPRRLDMPRPMSVTQPSRYRRSIRER